MADPKQKSEVLGGYNATKEENERTMKFLVQSKIEANNIMRDLDALDNFTDDWPEQGNLRVTALAIHLRCEEASNQCQGIVDALEGLATAEEGASFEEDFVTMTVRQESAQGKIDQISSLLEGVITGTTSKEEQADLSVDEMKTRTQAIMESLTELKKGFEGLKVLCESIVVKWQTETLNKCILMLQEVVGKIEAAVEK
jgi:hypothetical protein